MKLLVSGFAFLSALSFPVLALAGLSPDAHGHAPGGIKWWGGATEDDPRIGLLILLINFAVLMWVLNKILFSKLRASNAKKSDAIREQLDRATSARNEAEEQLKNANAKLDALEKELQEIRDSAKASAEAEKKRILEQAEADAEKIRNNARKSAERDAARKRAELESEIVTRALDDAESRIRSGFSADDQKRLFEGYLSEVGAELTSGRTGLNMNGSLAKRYAKALFSISDNPAKRDQFLEQLETFYKAAKAELDHPGNDMLDTLEAIHVSLPHRLAIAEKVAKSLGCSTEVTEFIKLLVDRGRISGLVLVVRHFREMVDEAAGRLRGTVRSALPIGDAEINKLQAALSQATGKTVLLDTVVDPELIGGVVTQIGSFTLDRSIRSSLDSLRRGMMASA